MKGRLFKSVALVAAVAVAGVGFSYASQCVRMSAAAGGEISDCCRNMQEAKAVHCSMPAAEISPEESRAATSSSADACPHDNTPENSEDDASGVAKASADEPQPLAPIVCPANDDCARTVFCPRAEDSSGRKVLSQESKLLI